MVVVVVSMKIEEGRMSEFLEACAEVRPQVLAENGCLAYDYNREIQSPLRPDQPYDPNRVVLIERWESAEALAAHGKAPHVKTFGTRVKDIRSDVQITVVEPIAVG